MQVSHERCRQESHCFYFCVRDLSLERLGRRVPTFFKNTGSLRDSLREWSERVMIVRIVTHFSD